MWKRCLLLSPILVLGACLWGCRAAGPSGPFPAPRDVHSPADLSPELARTRIHWGHYTTYLYLDGTLARSIPLLPQNQGVTSTTLSPSGRYLAYTSWAGSQIEWLDLETGEHRVLLTEKDAFPTAMGIGSFGLAFTPDEREVIFEVGWSDGGALASVDVASGDVQVIYRGGWNLEPHVSPDGRWIVVECDGKPGEGWALCLIDRQTRTRTHLTDDEDFDPSGGGWFTPDGQSVVYVAHDFGPFSADEDRIYRVGADGQGKRLLVSVGWPIGLLAVTADEVVFTCQQPERPGCDWVCVIRLDGTDARRLTYLGEKCWAQEEGTP